MTLNFGNNLFPPRGELLTNYDYFDISNGTGYDIFYLGDGNNGETFVNTQIVPSESVSTSASVDTIGTATKVIEKVYDLQFNLPKIINGAIYIAVPLAARAYKFGGDVTAEVYAKIRAYHYDGSSETLIGSEKTTATASVTDTTSDSTWKWNSLMGTVIIETGGNINFKKGEILRVDIDVYGLGGTTTSAVVMGHDPAGRSEEWFTTTNFLVGANTTRAQMNVPFKLNI